MNHRKLISHAISVFFMIMLILGAVSVCVSAAEPDLITTEAELKEALHNAKEGDTILVGDIEFAYSPIGMTLSKGVTVKSGKDTPAVFSGGAFAVMGGASEQDVISIRFEDITFSGVNDIDSIDFTGKQIMTATKVRPAVFFSRCIDAAFVRCDFSGYSMANGGAVYGIYSSADSKGYRLSVSFEDCSLNSNAGGYGGAIYLSGAGNIFLSMKNCELSRNVAGYGGAIWADQTAVTLENCRITGNRFEDFYPDTLTKGGGIYVGRGTLTMKNCYVTDNEARNGGGVALSYTESDLDGCVISCNIARENGGGIWNENNGNNLVTIVNGTLANNTAADGGALYISENEAVLGGGGLGKTFLILSTLSGNTPAMKEYDAQRLSLFGCALHGEDRGEAMPSDDNRYCYATDVLHTGDPYEHLDGSIELDSAVLEGVAGDRFDNRHGRFLVGNNAHSDTTYRFLVDGEVKHTVTVGYGEQPLLPEYEKTGCTFDCWQYEDGCDWEHDSTVYVGGGSEFIDLCAVWTPNTYEVTFVSGEMQNKVSCAYGSPPAFPEPFYKNGQVFVGWFTMPDGGGEPIADGEPLLRAENVTYYAYYRNKVSALPIVLIASAVVLIIAGAAWFVISHRRNAAAASAFQAVVQPTEEPQASPIIVKTRYTDEEIDRIIQGTAETHIFTDRELFVFRELLKGKKQSEIAYYLGITVNTVKEYTRKVYGKLGVSNKGEMFDLISAKMNKNE